MYTESSSTPANHGGVRRGTTITSISPIIVETHIIPRMDAQTLATTACTSPSFRAMCMEERLWRDICNSMWPSTTHSLVREAASAFLGGHHSLFSDSLPILNVSRQKSSFSFNNIVHQKQKLHTTLSTADIISAVDIHYKNEIRYSKVGITNVGKDNFLDSKFEVKFVDQNDPSTVPVTFDDHEMYYANLKEHMTLSWIIIDPSLNRAVNVSSQRPVTVRPHWVGGDVEVKYAIIMSGDCHCGMTELVECRIVVMLGWKDGSKLEVRGVKLEMKDMDDKCLSWKDSMGILHEAMHKGQRKKGERGEEKKMHLMFLDRKRERREGRERRERRLKMLHKIIPTPSATIFLALLFIVFFVSRLLNFTSMSYEG